MYKEEGLRRKWHDYNNINVKYRNKNIIYVYIYIYIHIIYICQKLLLHGTHRLMKIMY